MPEATAGTLVDAADVHARYTASACFGSRAHRARRRQSKQCGGVVVGQRVVQLGELIAVLFKHVVDRPPVRGADDGLSSERRAATGDERVDALDDRRDRLAAVDDAVALMDGPVEQEVERLASLPPPRLDSLAVPCDARSPLSSDGRAFRLRIRQRRSGQGASTSSGRCGSRRRHVHRPAQPPRHPEPGTDARTARRVCAGRTAWRPFTLSTTPNALACSPVRQ